MLPAAAPVVAGPLYNRETLKVFASPTAFAEIGGTNAKCSNVYGLEVCTGCKQRAGPAPFLPHADLEKLVSARLFALLPAQACTR
jgi:hypothetical protein